MIDHSNRLVIEKNTQKGSLSVLFEKEDLSLSFAENRTPEMVSMDSLIQKGIIHFYFCLEGSAAFAFGPLFLLQSRQGFALRSSVEFPS